MDPFEQPAEHQPQQPQQPAIPRSKPPVPLRKPPTNVPPAIIASTLRPRHRNWWQRNYMSCIATAILLIVVSIAYGNSFVSGWVLDNRFIIIDDPRLREFSHKNIGLIFSKDYWWPKAVGGLYRPITTLTYLINFTMSKQSPWTYHVVNLLLHWANAVMVYFVSLRVIKRFWPALVAALIFAVHPIATESVTNIIGRADQLAAAAVLGGLLTYIRSTKASNDFTQWMWLLATVAIQFLGMLCKESAIVLVGAIALYDITFRLIPQRDGNSPPLAAYQPSRRKIMPPVVTTILGYLLFVPALGVIFLIRWLVASSLAPPELPFLDNPLRGANFIDSRLTAFKVLGRMLWLLIWPKNLCCDYAYDQIPLVHFPPHGLGDWEGIVAMLLVLMILAAGVWAWRKNRAVFFFVMFLFMAYAPTGNFLTIIGSNMAERFMYLPLVGYAGLLAIAIEAVAKKIAKSLEKPAINESSVTKKRATFPWMERPQWITLAITASLVLIFGVRTFVRNFDWRSDVTLWTSAIKISPNSFRVHEQLAFAIYQENPEAVDRPIELIAKTIDILDPLPLSQNNAVAYIHYGKYLGVKGEQLSDRRADNSIATNAQSRPYYQKAIAILEKAREIDLNHNKENREIEISRGKNPDLIRIVGLPNIYEYLTFAYMRLGEPLKALDAAIYYRQFDPLNVDGYIKVAEAELALNRARDASITLVQIVILDGSQKGAWNILAEIYRNDPERDCAQAIVYDRGTNKPHLNSSCYIVRRDVNEAILGIVRICLKAKAFNEARAIKEQALKSYNEVSKTELNKLVPD